MVLAHNFNGVNRTQDVKISRDVTFETMLLNDNTLQGLKDSGFYKPSPIQLHGIPLGKCGFDLLLEAKSGTGKTAVFTVIALEKINLNNGLQVVILAPTREIAAQICDVIIQIGAQYSGLSVEVVMGGLPVKDDIEKLQKKVHIIVGSPGRLHHLIKDKHIDMSSVRLLVLDEADKLMEKSFRSDIDYIYSSLPQLKQIILSSATFSEESKAFINQYVEVPQHICPDSKSVLLGITQTVTVVSHNSNVVRQTQNKFEELLNILSKRQFKQCLIFCNYQARVTDLHKMLIKAKWPAEKLYGKQEQIDRLDALKILQQYKCRILIATDLAARGLDSSHVDLVVNFEIPREWQTYLHRIGRAGRFGTYGLAVSILSTKEENQFKELMNSLQFRLHIKHFWSDEQFEYTDLKTPDNNTLEKTLSSPSCYKEVAEEDVYQDLWDALTCESVQHYEVETSDNLCKSLEGTNDNVETFENLLESFNNWHVNSDDKESSALSTNSVLRSKSIEKLIKRIQNSHCSSKKTLSREHSNTLEKTLSSPSCYKEVAEEDVYQDLWDALTCESVQHYEVETSDNLCKSLEGTNDNVETFENLLESFNNWHVNSDDKEASALSTNSVLRSKSIEKLIKRVQNSHCSSKKTFSREHSRPSPEEKIEEVNLIMPEASVPNSISKQDTPFLDQFSYKTKVNIKQSSIHYNETKPSKSFDVFQEDDTSDESDDYGYNTASYNNSITTGSRNNYYYPNNQKGIYSSNYINWYNYLKFRTKQIEMAVYIDEMSKLKM